MSKLLDFTKFVILSNWSVAHLLESQFQYNKNFKLEKVGAFLKRSKTQVVVDDDTEYKRVTIKLYNKGVFLRNKEYGRNIGTKKQFLIKEGQFLLSKIDARNSAFGLATEEVDGAIITADFFAYDIDITKIEPYFLVLLTTTKKFQHFAQSASSGTTGRQRIDESKFLEVKIPLPSLKEQKNIVKKFHEKFNLAKKQELEASQKESEIEKYLKSILALKKIEDPSNKLLNFIKYEQINSWSYRDLLGSFLLVSNKFETVKLVQKSDLYIDVFRGKSPKYSDKSDSIILNQKCIRWNCIELEHSKSVDDDWYQNIDKSFFTKKGDILINSTGDGTIGRATCITEKYINLIYDSHILLLRVNPEKINPLFLTYFINSSLGQLQIENIKSAVATKQTELGIHNLKNMQFILPPIDIQNEIAEKIELLKNEIKSLNQKSEQNKDLAVQDFESEIFNEA